MPRSCLKLPFVNTAYIDDGWRTGKQEDFPRKLKYLVSSFVGVFVGFLGGSAVGTEKQAQIDKPEAVSKGHD